LTNLYEKERTVSHDNAYASLSLFTRSLNLNWELTLDDSQLEVTSISLRDTNDVVISSGSGKGKNHRVGALAEAIEHYICFSRYREHEKVSIKKLLAQKEFSTNWIFSEIENSQMQETLEVEKFISLDTKNEVYVPVGLIDPEVAAEKLKSRISLDAYICKFASNNGAALGLTQWDSILHGLNEVIERHYESKLYQSIIGYRKNAPWYYYQGKNNSLSMDKKKEAESLGGRAMVIYTPTIAGTYVAFAFYCDARNYLISPIGAGSSMYKDLAAQRALDELVQSLVIIREGDDNLKKGDEFYHSFLSSNKGLKPLINFPLKNILKILTKNDHIEKLQEPLSTKEQSTLIIKELVSNGFTPLVKSYASSEVFLNHVFVPQFDMFFMIRRGVPVAPPEIYAENNLEYISHY